MSIVPAFLEWAEHDRRRSPNTLARYRAVLASLAQVAAPETASIEDVEAWWATRLDRSEATRANELACLRSFYRWATRFGHRADDPTRRLDAPKIPNHVPRPVGEADVRKLLDAAADEPALRRTLALGAYAGLRVSEAAGLDWSGIDEESRRIYVRGKGRKERVFGLSPVLLDLLLPRVEGNVVTAGGQPYSAGVLQRRVNRFMARSGVEHTFHDLRKRAATLAIAKTGDVYAVAKAFGWSSVETASAYAVVSDEALDRIAAAIT